VALGGARREIDGALQLCDGLVETAFARQDEAKDIVPVGGFGGQLNALEQLCLGLFATVTHDLQNMAKVDVRGAVVGIEFDGTANVGHSLVHLAVFSQRAAKVVVGLGDLGEVVAQYWIWVSLRSLA
jgi:hypothetical protein